MTAVYNAANEEAAEAFLAGRIGFPAIVRTIADVLRAADQWAAEPATVEDVLDAQRWARRKAQLLIDRGHTGGPTNPMMFVIGIVLFALAILISVALHECGHMWVALGTGMKVRRYFVGFGPTLWSTRRGETEYGVKAIPAGGFCDIAGMTSVEELAPDEHDRAMYKQKTWKRVAVLFAGPGMNFVIGLVLIYAIAVVWGLPNLHAHPRSSAKQPVSLLKPSKASSSKCTGPGPAAAAGIRAGDVVLKVGNTPVTDFTDMAAAVQKLHGTVPIVIKRDGQTMTKYVDIDPAAALGHRRQGRREADDDRCDGRRGRGARANAVQRGHRGAGHVRLHRQPDRSCWASR